MKDGLKPGDLIRLDEKTYGIEASKYKFAFLRPALDTTSEYEQFMHNEIGIVINADSVHNTLVLTSSGRIGWVVTYLLCGVQSHETR